MKNFFIGVMSVVLLSTAFAKYSDHSLSTQGAGNILAKLGRKAWYAFNDTNIEIARVTKFGFNNDVDSAAIEILGSFGGAFLQRDLSAETLTIVSTDADDVTSTGTGARDLLLTCIDEDGLEVSVVVNLNGTTPVITTQTCKFVNRVAVFAGGSSKTNEGTISIVQTTSGVQLGEVPIGRSSTQQVLYYVPADRVCYVDSIDIHARRLAGGSNPKVTFNVIVYSQTQDILYDIREYYMETSADTKIHRVDFKAEPLRPNEIIVIDILTDTNNTIVTGSMEFTCRINL